VGQSTFFEACSLEPSVAPTVGMETEFIEFRGGGEIGPVLERLEAFRPQVTVVFRPDVFPAGALHDVPGALLGFLTEPLPRQGRKAVRHPDLDRRLADLGAIDPLNVDRVVCFDPKSVPSAEKFVSVWRALPLPVADRYYRPVGAPVLDPKALFVGRSTPHREKYLSRARESGELLHLAFGVDADHLQQLMAEYPIAINVHNEPYPTFENRASLHLAAGQLLISEGLSPSHGLEGGIDFLVAGDGDVLAGILDRIRHLPTAWHDVRLRGRRKAELFRASHVYPRLFFDLLNDLHSRPSERPGAARELVA